jgi:hypothetical protein
MSCIAFLAHGNYAPNFGDQGPSFKVPSNIRLVQYVKPNEFLHRWTVGYLLEHINTCNIVSPHELYFGFSDGHVYKSHINTTVHEPDSTASNMIVYFKDDVPPYKLGVTWVNPPSPLSPSLYEQKTMTLQSLLNIISAEISTATGNRRVVTVHQLTCAGDFYKSAGRATEHSLDRDLDSVTTLIAHMKMNDDNIKNITQMTPSESIWSIQFGPPLIELSLDSLLSKMPKTFTRIVGSKYSLKNLPDNIALGILPNCNSGNKCTQWLTSLNGSEGCGLHVMQFLGEAGAQIPTNNLYGQMISGEGTPFYAVLNWLNHRSATGDRFIEKISDISSAAKLELFLNAMFYHMEFNSCAVVKLNRVVASGTYIIVSKNSAGKSMIYNLTHAACKETHYNNNARNIFQSYHQQSYISASVMLVQHSSIPMVMSTPAARGGGPLVLNAGLMDKLSDQLDNSTLCHNSRSRGGRRNRQAGLKS